MLKEHFAREVANSEQEIGVLPYQGAAQDLLSKIPKTGYCWTTESLHVQISGAITSQKITTTVSEVCMMKALKNETEIAGMAQANVKAALAISKFLAWLEEVYEGGDISECDAADQLYNYYAKEDNFKSLSFDTISSANANGCILHYHATRGKESQVSEGVYLVDSGAQYLEGTTDTTRTVFLSKDPENHPKFKHVKDCYTRVLKCHLNLTMQKFPKGTTGYQLDVIARKHLWDVGLDFLHGTGHGIGCCLCVHEDPFHWGVRPKYVQLNTDNDDALVGHMARYYLQPNFVVSNEPGYYESHGGFGIRLENAIRVVDGVEMIHKEVFPREFYGFEDLIFCPYSKNLIDLEMLSSEEKQFLKAYNLKTREILLPILKERGDNQTYGYVDRNTDF